MFVWSYLPTSRQTFKTVAASFSSLQLPMKAFQSLLVIAVRMLLSMSFWARINVFRVSYDDIWARLRQPAFWYLFFLNILSRIIDLSWPPVFWHMTLSQSYALISELIWILKRNKCLRPYLTVVSSALRKPEIDSSESLRGVYLLMKFPLGC